MRHLKRLSETGRRRPNIVRAVVLLLVLALGVLLYDWHDLRADPFNDPLDELRQALKEDRGADKSPAILEYRESSLTKKAAKIENLGDLAEALMLNDWRDLGPDPDVSKLDARVRQGLAKRFEETAAKTLKSGTFTDRIATANLLAKMSAKARTMMPQGKLVRDHVIELSSDVADLTRVYDTSNPLAAEQVRTAGAEALGEIQGNPKITVPALRNLIEKERDPAPRRAAAAALVNMVRIISQSDSRQADLSERQPLEVGQYDVRRKELVQMGSEVVRAAYPLLKDRDREVRRLSGDAILQTAGSLADLVLQPPNMPLPPAGRAPTEKEAREIEMIRQMVQEDRNALSDLLNALNDSVPALRGAATDADPAIRLVAYSTLEQMGNTLDKLRRREQAIPRYGNPSGPQDEKKGARAIEDGVILLVQAIQPEPREKPADDPLKAGLTDKATMATLKNGLRDPDWRVRLASVEALEMLGPLASSAVPDITAELVDQVLWVRWASARTLGRIGPVSYPPAVEGLARIVQSDPDLDARLAAATALQRYGAKAEGAVPALRFAMRTGDPDLRIQAIRTVDSIGTAASSALPDLAVALTNTDVRVRRTAVNSIGRFCPMLWEKAPAAANEVIAALKTALGDTDNEVSRKASEALLRIPPPKALPPPKKDL